MSFPFHRLTLPIWIFSDYTLNCQTHNYRIQKSLHIQKVFIGQHDEPSLIDSNCNHVSCYNIFERLQLCFQGQGLIGPLFEFHRCFHIFSHINLLQGLTKYQRTVASTQETGQVQATIMDLTESDILYFGNEGVAHLVHLWPNSLCRVPPKIKKYQNSDEGPIKYNLIHEQD